jgi:hypothetical protein
VVDSLQNNDAPQRQWFAMSLRITLFLKEAINVDAPPKWWEEIVGNPPEAESRQRAQGLFQQDGAFGRGRLSLAILSGNSRIDWIWRALGPEAPSYEFPVLGAFRETGEEFAGAMKGWLDKSSLAGIRLAFGAELAQPVDSVRDGYIKLGEHLKRAVKVDPESTDFLYRVNRPRMTESMDHLLKINRLSTWAVMQARYINILMPGGGEAIGQFATAPASQVICRLELDINSTADSSETMEALQLKRLLDEFLTFALEISERGDVP